jgi:hypothetical protein
MRGNHFRSVARSGFEGMMPLPPNRPTPTDTTRLTVWPRIGLLALCAGVGAAIGFVARQLGAGDAGFLAIPVGIAVGWFAVADPTTCTPAHRSHNDRGPAR